MEVNYTSRENDIDVILRLRPEPSSVGEARRFVDATLQSWFESSVAEVVVLLTSEVVTNVVLHAGPHQAGDEMVMGIVWDENVIRVEVADHASHMPVVRKSPDAIGGRGLPLLDALASAWGVTPDDTGKVVWFEVRPMGRYR